MNKQEQTLQDSISNALLIELSEKNDFQHLDGVNIDSQFFCDVVRHLAINHPTVFNNDLKAEELRAHLERRINEC